MPGETETSHDLVPWVRPVPEMFERPTRGPGELRHLGRGVEEDESRVRDLGVGVVRGKTVEVGRVELRVGGRDRGERAQGAEDVVGVQMRQDGLRDHEVGCLREGREIEAVVDDQLGSLLPEEVRPELLGDPEHHEIHGLVEAEIVPGVEIGHEARPAAQRTTGEVQKDVSRLEAPVAEEVELEIPDGVPVVARSPHEAAMAEEPHAQGVVRSVRRQRRRSFDPRMPGSIPRLLAAVLALVAGACTPERSSHRVLDRWTPETDAVLEADAPRREIVAFDWSFFEESDRAPWSLRALVGEGRHGFAIPGEPNHESPWMERSVVLDAGDVSVVELEATPGHRHVLDLWFAPCGEELRPERRMRFRPVLGTRPALFRASVGDHGAWRGEICRIGVSVEAEPRARFRLRRLRGLHRVFDPDLAARISRLPHEVTVGGETRSARVIYGSGELRRSFRVPAEGALEGAVATGSDGPARFSIERRAVGEVVLALDREVTSGVAERAWVPFRLDLGSFAGEEVELRLGIESEDPESPSFWGDLRLVGRVDEARRPDVLLVVVDTLRADRLSLYGHARSTTPHLEKWARERAVVFRTVVAPAPWTIPSHESLFTGMDPLHHGRHATGPAPRSYLRWAEILQREGYETTASTDGGFLAADFGFARGFDRWQSRVDPDPEDLAARAERLGDWLLDPGDRPPRFAFLHTYDVHAPYRARSPWFERFAGPEAETAFLAHVRTTQVTDGSIAGAVVRRELRVDDPETGRRTFDPAEIQWLRAAYDSGIAFVDDALSELLARAASAPRPVLIVLTSDHGEALGEHGLGDHAVLYDHTLLVPLVVAFPDRFGAGTTVSRQVRLIDVLPTVLDTLGIDGPEGLDGDSLRRLVADPSAPFPGEAWIASAKQGLAVRVEDRFKVIGNTTLRRRDVAESAAFDLEVDPEELVPLPDGAHPEVARWMARLRRRHRERLADATFLRVENPTAEPLRLDVSTTAPLHLDQVHGADGSPPRLFDADVGRFVVEGPPGTTFSLALEGVTVEHDLTWTLAGNPPCTVGPSGHRGRPGARLRLDAGCGIVGDASLRTPTVSVTLSEGARAPSPGTAPDTVRHLESLGYLE